MYFTTHLLTGAAVGGAAAAAGGPGWVAFLAGVVSHAALDMVPHHDYYRARYALYDIVLGLIIATVALSLHPGPGRLWGGLGGVLPDLEVALGYLLVQRGYPARRGHFPSHTGFLPHPHWPLPQGLLIQTALASVGLWLLVR